MASLGIPYDDHNWDSPLWRHVGLPRLASLGIPPYNVVCDTPHDIVGDSSLWCNYEIIGDSPLWLHWDSRLRCGLGSPFLTSSGITLYAVIGNSPLNAFGIPPGHHWGFPLMASLGILLLYCHWVFACMMSLTIPTYVDSPAWHPRLTLLGNPP